MNDAERRDQMVETQLAGRGISDARVLQAFRSVPRELFVPEPLAHLAYEDAPVSIGEGQTISQPYVVALIAEALHIASDETVLEIGTGSGYAAAILARLARRVFTVERLERMASEALRRLAAVGCVNVEVRHGDGTLGWLEHAPFDAIAVAAGGPSVPEALLDQLAPGGRLVMPVGPSQAAQELVRIIRDTRTRFREETLGPVRFVPLIGEQGWHDGGRVTTP